MFSFHKPRVYRSVSGCCICRAKSSSSRFTDSKRYEDVFFECFKLIEDRSGEICNACVLLVKRWKKLPLGSQRNWKHVVDARAGHGSKPLSKINKVKKNKVSLKMKPINATLLKQEILADDRENDFQIPPEAAERMQKDLFIPQIKRNRVSSPSAFSDDIQLEYMSSGSGSYHSSLETSPVPSPVNVDDEDSTNCLDSSQLLNGRVDSQIQNIKSKRRRGKAGLQPQKNRTSISSFLDLTFWKREKTCCGIVFKGPFGEVLLDRRFLNPCRSNTSSLSPQCETVPSVTVKGTSIECFAIDSGYEDSSSSTIESYRMLPNSVSGVQKDVIKNKMLVGPYVSNYSLKVD